MIRQGYFDSEVIICFGTFKLSVDLIQLLKVITVLGFTLSHCHKLFVERYILIGPDVPSKLKFVDRD